MGADAYRLLPVYRNAADGCAAAFEAAGVVSPLHYLTACGDSPGFSEIEVQGARQVRQAIPDSVAVFIAPPSLDALRARLVGRGTDSPEEVDERLRTAERELEAQPEFAHVVVNDRLEQATDELEGIVRRRLPAR